MLLDAKKKKKNKNKRKRKDKKKEENSGMQIFSRLASSVHSELDAKQMATALALAFEQAPHLPEILTTLMNSQEEKDKVIE